jgi:hypothetical protein
LTLSINWGLRTVVLHNFDILETAVIEALELILEIKLVYSNKYCHPLAIINNLTILPPTNLEIK